MPTRTQFLITRVGVYCLDRHSWRPDQLDRADDPCRLVPVCVCGTREQASDERRLRETEGRRFLNPFRRATNLEWLTSLSPAEFRARTRQLGVSEPFPSERNKMVGWWDEAVRPLPDDVHNAVWDLLDKLPPLYHILEIEVED